MIDTIAGSAGIESMLDIETITGVAGNIETEFWGFKGRSPDDPENEPFMRWLTTVSTTSDKEVRSLRLRCLSGLQNARQHGLQNNRQYMPNYQYAPPLIRLAA